MAAGDQAPPVLARRAHKANQIGITTGGARRMHAVRGIPVVAAEGGMRRGDAARCLCLSVEPSKGREKELMGLCA